MTVLNMSFAAAGFLGMYHIGAAEAFLRHGHKLLGSVEAYAGASAGSMVAAALVTAPDQLEAAKDFMNALADGVRQRQFGAIVPGHKLMHMLRDGAEAILPSEAHRLANGRLHISITDIKSGRNHIVSRFASREELITALLASSYLPIYAGIKPVEFRGQKWIDGCFSDSLPILPVGRTITVSPFAGAQDVCPVHRGCLSTSFTMTNMNIMLSAENLKRLCQSMIPPSPGRMQSFHEEGFSDAVEFLKREAWLSSQSDPLVKRTDDDEA